MTQDINELKKKIREHYSHINENKHTTKLIKKQYIENAIEYRKNKYKNINN